MLRDKITHPDGAALLAEFQHKCWEDEMHKREMVTFWRKLLAANPDWIEGHARVRNAEQRLDDAMERNARDIAEMREILTTSGLMQEEEPKQQTSLDQSRFQNMEAAFERNQARVAAILRPGLVCKSGHSSAKDLASVTPPSGEALSPDQVLHKPSAQSSALPIVSAATVGNAAPDHQAAVCSEQSKGSPTHQPAALVALHGTDSALPGTGADALTLVGKGAQDTSLKSATSSPDSIALNPPPSTLNG